MNAPISPDIEKKIHTLCDEIASAEDLSEELHEELYTHIEDKVLGYLSGEELLNDEDAYLLAEAHFGDRALVRFQMEDVHPMVGTAGFMRRLAVPMMVHACLIFFYSSIFAVLAWSAGATESSAIFNEVIITFGSLTFIFIQFKLLSGWKRREQSGKSLWFQQWSTRKLYSVLVGLCIVLALLSTVRIFVWLAIIDPEMELVFQFSSFFTMVILYLPSLATLLTWYFWFDIKPRARGTFALLGLAFLVFQGICSLMSSPVRMQSTYIETDYVLMEGAYYYVTFNFMTTLHLFIGACSFYLIPTLCIGLVYSLWSRFRGPKRVDFGMVSSDS